MRVKGKQVFEPIRLTRLPVGQRHNKCLRCNYGGCTKDSLLSHLRFNLWLRWTRIKAYYRAWIRSFSDLDYSKIADVEVDGIDTRDYPDFCDAYIASASYGDREMTEAELERLNEDRDFVYEAVNRHLF